MIYFSIFLTILILGIIAMSIYFGNTKIGKIFFGSTEIGKVYHGNTLVFENNKRLPLYGYDSYYILGSNSTSGIVVGDTLDTISAITGTLGASGSKVRVSDSVEPDFNDKDFTFYKSITYNNVKVYIYAEFILSGRSARCLYVIEDARVGSKCCEFLCNTGYPDNPNNIYYSPSAVTSTSMTCRFGTFNRKASKDTNYTRKGYAS